MKYTVAYVVMFQGECVFQYSLTSTSLKQNAYKISHTQERNSQLEHLNAYLLLFLLACKMLFSYSFLNSLC